MKKQYLIYSAGNMGITIKRYAEALEMKIVAFYDNKKELQGEQVDDLPVYSLKELEEYVARGTDNVIIIGSQVYYEELLQEITGRFGSKVDIISPDYIQKKYWDEIVLQKRERLKECYSISYHEQVKDWMENLMTEVEYWVRSCASKNGAYHKGYCDRINRKNTYFKCERLQKKIRDKNVIIDAGCGICSQYGTVVENGNIQLFAIDPLAYFYNKINEKSLQIADNPVQFGMFEFLSLFIGQGVADVVLIDNALDHCIDPFKSIIESYITLKMGGILSMRHRRCEAVYEGYMGLHKWNVDVNDRNELILWNNENMKNVNKELAQYCDIQVVLHENENRCDEFIDVNIVKKKELNLEEFYNREECIKLANVINEIMRLFSSEKINAEFAELLKELE